MKWWQKSNLFICVHGHKRSRVFMSVSPRHENWCSGKNKANRKTRKFMTRNKSVDSRLWLFHKLLGNYSKTALWWDVIESQIFKKKKCFKASSGRLWIHILPNSQKLELQTCFILFQLSKILSAKIFFQISFLSLFPSTRVKLVSF